MQMMQITHRHVCDMVATYFNVEAAEVLENVVDSGGQVGLLEDFFAKQGELAIIFYFHQMGPMPTPGKSI